MLRYVLIPLMALALPATTYAHIIYHLLPVDNSSVLPGDDPAAPDFNNGSYYTFDLAVSVATSDGGGDAWTWTIATATIDGPGSFFLHPEGNRLPADPSLVAQYPALEFDTYFTTVSGYPTSFETLSYQGPGPGVVTEIHAVQGETYAMGFYTGGPYQVARFTVKRLEPGHVTLAVSGYGGHLLAPGTVTPFGPLVVTIPEPATALLAAFLLPALLRRR